MTRRAIFTKADLKRAVLVAKEHGYEVRVDQDSIRLLPIATNSNQIENDDARRIREAFGR
jgi:hypothetical protein